MHVKKSIFAELEQDYNTATNIQEYESVAMQAKDHCYTDLLLRAAQKVYDLATIEQKPVAAKNLAHAFNHSNFPEHALDLNSQLDQSDFDVLFQRAATLMLMNRRAESSQILAQLAALPILTELQKNLLWYASSHQKLSEGLTAEGIDCFINTKKQKTTALSLKGIKQWNGIPHPNHVLYINANGGYGDEIINIRFFEHVKKLGMHPILYSDLERVDIDKVLVYNGIKVINSTDDIKTTKFTLWCDLMALPVLLNVTERELWNGPYLKPKPLNNLVSAKKKIGIKSHGNPYFAANAYRPIPLDQMLEIIPKDKYDVYLFDLDMTHPDTINIGTTIQNWSETFGYLSQMDMVLSSCTSVAHAAGSMGIPTIVCVPINEYYTWTSTRTGTSTPWYDYDQFYLLKQQTVRSWKEPLQHAKRILEQ